MELRSYGGIYFRLRWTVNAPVSLDGPFLSASLPTVEIPLTETTDQTTDLGARVRMVLAPDAGDTSYYSLQATPSPSEAASNSWTWSETGSNVQTETFGTAAVATPPIYVAAVNAGGTQLDTVRVFFAGVFLGIAGAALITIAQELISPLSRRRDARHPV